MAADRITQLNQVLGFVETEPTTGMKRGWRMLHRLAGSGYVLMVLAAVGFSFKSILVKMIYDKYETDALTIMLMRFYMGAPCFAAALLLLEGFAALRTNPREILVFLFMGVVGLGGATFFSFLAIASLGASLASIVVFSYPVMTLMILAALDRRVQLRQVFAASSALFGLALVVRLLPEGIPETIAPVGVAYGLISAFCFAGYNVMIERVAGGSSPVRQAAFSVILLTLAATVCFGDRSYPEQPQAWLLAGLLAIGAGFFPFLMFLYGIRRIGAGPGTIANLMGPAFNLVWAYLFFGEIFNALQLCGVVLIFGGVASLKGGWFVRGFAKLQPILERFAGPPKRAPGETA